MRQLSAQYSLERFWDSMIFTVAATEAWPETAPLGADLSAHLEVGQALRDRMRAIRWTVVRANAKIVAMDLEQERHLVALAQDVLVLAKFDRQAPIYTFLFKSSVAVIKRHALERQTVSLEEIVAKLGNAELIPESLRAKHLPVLQADIAQAHALLGARRQAWIDRSALRLESDAWKREANALRTALYAELLALNPNEGRSFAERFFSDTPDAEPEPTAPA